MSLDKPKRFIDARNLINREQIDAANTPVLFVELASGQNGTLTPYPVKVLVKRLAKMELQSR